MKAEEARKLLSEATKDLEAKDLVMYKGIIHDIKQAIKTQLATSITVAFLPAVIIKRLEEDGYTVKTEYDFRDGDYCIINW